MKASIKVFLYGAGRAARSLGRAIEADQGRSGVQLNGAWNRSFPRALQTSQLLDVEVSSGDAVPEAMRKADVILLGVPDDAIAPVAALLAPHLGRRQVLLHCSGSLAGEVMRGAQMRCWLGSCHPLQALAQSEGDPEKLAGATFAIEGDPEAMEAARRLVQAVGGRPLELHHDHKALYHAAAVMSANYMTVLVDAACEMLGEAGIDATTSVDILLPLLRGTLDQLEAQHHRQAHDPDPDADPGRVALSHAITGPVRRGDVGTVARHLKALDKLAQQRASASDLPALYRLLGRRALRVVRREHLELEQCKALEVALRDRK